MPPKLERSQSFLVENIDGESVFVVKTVVEKSKMLIADAKLFFEAQQEMVDKQVDRMAKVKKEKEAEIATNLKAVTPEE